MDEATEYLMTAIRTAVWSGFYPADEVREMLAEWLEDDGDGADEAALLAAVPQEFAKKQAAEATWPAVTDCDRLDRAFEALGANGVIALHNAGYTMSDGLDDVSETLAEQGRDGVRGYCFYHGQDLERALAGGGLLLAFGSLDDEVAPKVAVGRAVQAALQEAGLVVEWGGDPEARLLLPQLAWQRRGND